MNLGNLRTLSRSITPGASTSKVSNALLDIVINSIVLDIASYAKTLKTNKKFNVVADQSEYNLSTVVPLYLIPDKPGLWWYDGEQWQEIYKRSLKWLDVNRPNWRDLDSDDPRDYSIDGNVLTISPPPESALTEGLWLYYAKVPKDMSSTGHFPFSGSTTELTYLKIFDWAIAYGARWKMKPMLSKARDEFNQDRNLYLAQREVAMKQFRRRPDINADVRMQGPIVRA